MFAPAQLPYTATAALLMSLQPILVSLGGSSMAIYLFHRVWAVAFTFVLGYRAEMIANHELNKPASLQHWQIFLPYLLSLLLLCGLWHHAVEVPLSAAVRRWCATCAEGGDEKQPPRPRSSGTANLESGTRTSSHEGQGERARRLWRVGGRRRWRRGGWG